MRDHRSFFGHTVLLADNYPSKDQFIQIAKDNGKCVTDECNRVINFVSPTSAPPQIAAQNQESSQISIISTNSQANGGSVIPRQNNYNQMSL
jgi:hypothetical protein